MNPLKYLKHIKLLKTKGAKDASQRLNQQQVNTLNLMREDNYSALPPFKATKYWQFISDRFDRFMQKNGIQNPEEQYYNTQFSQHLTTKDVYYRYALWMLYQLVKNKDSYKILDKVKPSLDASSEYVYKFGAHLVSWDYLISIDNLYSISELNKAIFDKPLVVVDLGAGWGRIGYILKKINPKCTYVIADLPEPLLISMTHLPKLLKKDKITSYTQVREINKITRKKLLNKNIWFCGPQHLQLFEDKSVDVFINISSFQEMDKKQVSQYLDLIDKKVKGAFFTLQYWENSELHDTMDVVRGLGDYSFSKNWEQKFIRNTTFSERYFEAGFLIK